MKTAPAIDCKHCATPIKPCRCHHCGTPGWRHKNTAYHRCGSQGLDATFAEPEGQP